MPCAPLWNGVSTRSRANACYAVLQSVHSLGALTAAVGALLEEVSDAAEERAYLLGQGPGPSLAFLNKQILGEFLKSWSLRRTTFQDLTRQTGQQKREHQDFHLFLVVIDGLTLSCFTE